MTRPGLEQRVLPDGLILWSHCDACGPKQETGYGPAWEPCADCGREVGESVALAEREKRLVNQ